MQSDAKAVGLMSLLFQSLIGSNRNCNEIAAKLHQEGNWFQSLIGSNRNCNKRVSSWNNQIYGFQSLIGSNRNCNESTVWNMVEWKYRFQSLIGSNRNCNQVFIMFTEFLSSFNP